MRESREEEVVKEVQLSIKPLAAALTAVVVAMAAAVAAAVAGFFMHRRRNSHAVASQAQGCEAGLKASLTQSCSEQQRYCPLSSHRRQHQRIRRVREHR